MSNGKKIPLEEGGFATVDAKDYDLLRHFTWHQCGFCKHVFRTIYRRKDGAISIYMAAEVMGDETMEVNGACNPCPAVPELKAKKARSTES